MIVKSHHCLTGLLIALVLISGLVQPNVPTAQAADGWSGTQRITNNQIGIFPDIVTDSQGVSHIVYTETPDFNTSRIIRYMNNRAGQWSSPVTLSSSGLYADLGRLSTITINSNVYLALVYKGKSGNNLTSRIYYRLSTDGGVTWSSQEQITNVTSFEPAVSLDPSGQPHVTYSHAPTDLALGYTTKVGGAWTAPAILSSSSRAFNRDTSIGYTGSGATLTLHVVFTSGANGDENSKQIYYARKVGSGAWQVAETRQTTTGAGFPKLVTDTQSSVYAAWHVNSSAYGYETYFSRSTDNGTTWKTPQAIGSLTSDIGQTPAIARTPAGKLAVLWEDQYHTSDGRRDIYARTSDDNGTTWSGIQNVSAASGFSRNVAVAGGTAGFRAAWHDDRSGNYQIYTSAFSVGPGTPAGPSATPQLPVRTKDNAVSVNFASISGSPTELRWRWGAAPTDAANDSSGWQTFTNPKSIALPAGATACQSLTLYTQVKAGTAIEAAAKTATTQFDNAVQATVDVINPHLAGLPATFLSIADNSTTSASEGNPGYTREPYAFLRIADAGDCSGLSSFSVSTGNPSPPPAFTNGNYTGTVPLPQTNIHDGGGTAAISVAINDTLANLNNFAREIIYDPADTNSSTTVTNTEGLPVVNSGTATADNAANVIQTLTFSNLNVTDNVYGPKEGLSSTREFWGLWIANTTDPNEAATSDKLLWYPVRVPEPNANPLKVKWSIFTGLNIGLDPNKPGPYFVYVRFLDGAGNPSAASTAIKVSVTLPPGYSFPTLDMPLIRK
jgi:hypothetical protein